MIAVDPVPVALEPAAHRAQKRLHALAHLPIEQRTQPRRERRRAPSGPGRVPGRRIGHVPVGNLCQRRPQPRQDVADQRAGAEVEAEPDQSLALLVGHRGEAERQHQAARPGRGHSLEPPDRVRQVEDAIEHPFGVARRRNRSGRPNLPFAPASLVGEERTELVEPVALESDGNRATGAFRSEAEMRQLGPAQLFLQERRREHFESVRLRGPR